MSHSNIFFFFLVISSSTLQEFIITSFLVFQDRLKSVKERLEYHEEIPSEWKYMDIFNPHGSLLIHTEFYHELTYSTFEWNRLKEEKSFRPRRSLSYLLFSFMLDWDKITNLWGTENVQLEEIKNNFLVKSFFYYISHVFYFCRNQICRRSSQTNWK